MPVKRMNSNSRVMTSDGLPASSSHTYRCEMSSSSATCCWVSPRARRACCRIRPSACELGTAPWNVTVAAYYEDIVVVDIYYVIVIAQSDEHILVLSAVCCLLSAVRWNGDHGIQVYEFEPERISELLCQGLRAEVS